MSTIKSYLHGLTRASRLPKMTAVLWLFNFLLAVPAYMLMRAYLGGTIGPSLAASGLIKRLDMNTVLEVVTSSGVALGGLVTALAILIGLQVLVSIFCFGGVLSGLGPGGEDKPLAPVFFGGGGRFYGRFLRRTVYSLALWVPAVLVVLLVNAALSPLAANPVREQLGFVLTILQVFLAVLLAYGIKMILDYARIIIAIRDSRLVFGSLLEATRAVIRRPARPVGLYVLLSLTGWAAFFLYLGVQSLYARQTAGTIIIGFIIAQAFVASRGWLKIAFQAGQMDLWDSLGAGRQAQSTIAAPPAGENRISGEEAAQPGPQEPAS